MSVGINRISGNSTVSKAGAVSNTWPGAYSLVPKVEMSNDDSTIEPTKYPGWPM
jgi:hypothetical protein